MTPDISIWAPENTPADLWQEYAHQVMQQGGIVRLVMFTPRTSPPAYVLPELCAALYERHRWQTRVWIREDGSEVRVSYSTSRRKAA